MFMHSSKSCLSVYFFLLSSAEIKSWNSDSKQFHLMMT